MANPLLDTLLQLIGQTNDPSTRTSEGIITQAQPQQNPVVNDPMQQPAINPIDTLLDMPLDQLNQVLTPQQPQDTSANVQAITDAPQPYGANVNGGADRVNANTANTGIRAVVDENGNVTLTNLVGPSDNVMNLGANAPRIATGGSSYDSQGNAVDASGKAIPNVLPATQDQQRQTTNVHTLLQTLRNTSNPSEARGIMSQLTESVAAEQAKYYQKAQQFAYNKLQIPMIESQLSVSQELDARNGLQTESPRTTKLRGTLENLRASADNEAKRFLAGNPGYNSLIAATKDMDNQVQRITRIEDNNEKLTLQRTLSAEYRKQVKEDQLQQEAEGLTTEQKNRLRVLHPELAEADDVRLVSTLKKHLTKKDGYTEAIDAPDSDLPSMAISGNSYATAILNAKEAAAGVPPEVTSARLNSIKRVSTDPKALRQGIALISGTNNKKEIDAQMASINALSAPGASKENKQQASAIKLQAARAVVENQVAGNFIANVDSWAVPDPVLQTAITAAKNSTGKADMQSVLTEYLGATQGQERRQLIDNFTKYAVQAAVRTNKSQLGAVDPNKVKLAIQSTETRTFLEKLQDSFYGSLADSLNINLASRGLIPVTNTKPSTGENK